VEIDLSVAKIEKTFPYLFKDIPLSANLSYLLILSISIKKLLAS